LGEVEDMVQLAAGAGPAINSILATRGIRKPIRIDLHSTGCCDSSLCLCVDDLRDDDLKEQVENLIFIISPEIYDLVGEVKISLSAEKGKDGFVLSSSKPLNEWEGFGVCQLQV